MHRVEGAVRSRPMTANPVDALVFSSTFLGYRALFQLVQRCGHVIAEYSNLSMPLAAVKRDSTETRCSAVRENAFWDGAVQNGNDPSRLQRPEHASWLPSEQVHTLELQSGALQGEFGRRRTAL